MNESTFQHELASLLNKYSKEAGSNTPDFILAEYLLGCLDAFEKATKRTQQWHGNQPQEPI